MSLINSVWSMCGRLVGGVGPKMKTCYLLRVKQRLAFCCPVLPTKRFSVFFTMRILSGVFTFACSTGETTFSAHLCGTCAEECSTINLADKFLCGKLSETSDMVCLVVAAWNSLNQQGECLCHHRIYSPRWFIDFDQLFLLLRRRL